MGEGGGWWCLGDGCGGKGGGGGGGDSGGEGGGGGRVGWHGVISLTGGQH